MSSKPLIIRHRIGWLALALVPLLVTGVIAIYVGIQIAITRTIEAKPGAGWAVLALGALAILFSLAALSIRWDLEIDRPAGQVRRTRGLLGMNRSYAYDLSAFDQVLVSDYLLVSPSSQYDRYRVSLVGKDISVYLTEFSDLDAARKKATDVGEYAGLPVKIELKNATA